MKQVRQVGVCPVCGDRLRITELTCPSCRAKVVAELPTCEFCNLEPELLGLLRSFLRARGNYKEVERELGISYPTIRKRLDDLLAALGLEPRRRVSREERMEILDRLDRGEIGVDEALRLLGESKEG